MPAAKLIARTPPALSQFEIDGRIAVRHGETRYHANISWRHEAARDEILLTTPLGQGVAELSRDAAGARLLMADRREYAAADWEGLAERTFGARLPLNDLPLWLTGYKPGETSGWRIDYLDYQSDAADALPTLIEVRREDIELRLKVNEWIVAR